MLIKLLIRSALCCFTVMLFSACTPTVNVKSEPIEINMNVKIEHEVRIKVDRELEQAFENEALF